MLGKVLIVDLDYYFSLGFVGWTTIYVNKYVSLNWCKVGFWQFLLFPNVLINCTTIPHYE